MSNSGSKFSFYADTGILVTDVGATHFRVGKVVVQPDGTFELVNVREYETQKLSSAREGIERYKAEEDAQGVDFACFGVAGPVDGMKARMTNVSWDVDGRELASVLGLHENNVSVINDLVAIGSGIFALPAHDFTTLNAASANPTGPVAVIAAGTGLGEACCQYIPEIGDYRVFPSEGGHADWAPTDLEQLRVWLHLLAEHGRVRIEDVLSGRGICNIDRAFGHFEARGTHDETIAARAISEAARRCVKQEAGPPFDAQGYLMPREPSEATRHLQELQALRTMETFIDSYGAEARNLGLKHLATGGVVIAGGIAPANLELLMNNGRFMKAFHGRRDGTTMPGNISDLVEAMPVKVVMNEHIGMLGAARHALLRAINPD